MERAKSFVRGCCNGGAGRLKKGYIEVVEMTAGEVMFGARTRGRATPTAGERRRDRCEDVA